MVDLKNTSCCHLSLQDSFLKSLSTMQCDCTSEYINISRTFLKQLESMRNEKAHTKAKRENECKYAFIFYQKYYKMAV